MASPSKRKRRTFSPAFELTADSVIAYRFLVAHLIASCAGQCGSSFIEDAVVNGEEG